MTPQRNLGKSTESVTLCFLPKSNRYGKSDGLIDPRFSIDSARLPALLFSLRVLKGHFRRTPF